MRYLQKKAIEIIEKTHMDYNPAENLLKQVYISKGYHTKLEDGYAHNIRASIEYGVNLLFLKDKMYFDRGIKVIEKILSLQDGDPLSQNYGIWPYYLEEPLEKMTSPDWNWADFIGKELIHVLELDEILEVEFISKVKIALYHACKSIMRRNMGPDYTNISLMGSFVTIRGGELLKDLEIFNYGKKRIKKMLQYSQQNGGFSEYNSPNYSIIALEEIGRMMKWINDSEVIDIADQLNNIAWESLANHYHPITRQLAPPHGRAYDDIQSKRVISFIDIGIKGKLNLIDDEVIVDPQWLLLIITCPEKFHDYFTGISEERFVIDEFYKGVDIIADNEVRVNIEKNMHPLKAFTYMNKQFCLGSFEHYDLWNQRRPLMAYWKVGNNIAYMKLRCLHDGKDYASAILQGIQYKNQYIGGVHFVKDHGDFHFILDPLKEGKINGKELVLRFELGGAIDKIEIKECNNENDYLIISDKLEIELKILYAYLDNVKLQVQVGEDSQNKWIDIVFHRGDHKSLDFNLIRKAICLFHLNIHTTEVNHPIPYNYNIDEMNNIAYISMNQGEDMEQLAISMKPDSYIKTDENILGKKVKCGGFIYE